MKIYKHVLDQNLDEQVVSVHGGARFIAFRVQHNNPVIWAEEDTSQPKHAQWFRLVYTGDDVPEAPWKYAGTVLLDDGDYVLHLYHKHSEIA